MPIFNGDGMLDASEFWAMLSAICAGLITLSAVVNIVVSAIKKLKEPAETQNQKFDQINQRLDGIEAKMKDYEEYFDNDKKRIDLLQEGNRVTQKAILALMSHALDGNHTDELEEAKNKLQDYLLEK